MKGKNNCLFLDRDGTINVEKHFIKDPDDLELIPGAAQSIREAKEIGLKVIVVSNQSGVARGIMTEEDVNRVNDKLLDLLEAEHAAVDAIYYCPHYSDDDSGCLCRKPNTGMFERAKNEHDIDLGNSVMAGDRLSDIEAGKRIGAATMLVLTGYGSTVQNQWNVKPDIIDIVVPTLYDGMSFIKSKVNEWKKTGKEVIETREN